jgi:ribose transport system permease protein
VQSPTCEEESLRMKSDKIVEARTISLPGEVPESTPVGTWRRLASRQEFWITLAVLAMGLIVSMITPHFATYTNLSNVLQNFCYIGILAIGMTPILISGGIDISVGAIMGLCGVVLGLLLQADWPLWAGLPATLLLGVALGAINGGLVAYLRLPPFLVTLGMLSVARSMALIVSSGRVVYSFGQSEKAIFALGGGKMFGVPNVVYAMVASALALHFLLTMTRWGRYVSAIGGNQRAARLTGIPVRPIKVSVYMFGGLMAAITSVFLVGWLGSVTNALGQGDELRVIAGTVIGGASLAGGYGTAYGAMIGSLLIEELRNALLLAGVNPFWQGTFIGGFIILAIILQKIQVTEEED